jgi:predicted nucleic acid-binding protein
MRLNPRIFLDTSVLFAGIWSAEGGARVLLRLGEAGAIQLLISPQVLKEIEEVIRRKMPDRLASLAILIDRSNANVVPTAPEGVFAHCKELILHQGDARILADAWQHETDYLVTLDKAHFMNQPRLYRQIPFPIGTPGDCLEWYKNILQSK